MPAGDAGQAACPALEVHDVAGFPRPRHARARERAWLA